MSATIESARPSRLDGAQNDPLTGLPARALLVSCIEAALGAARHEQNFFTVACLDLDRFRTINESLGYSAGDRVLQEIAQRLSAAAGERGVVARLGGNQFFIGLFELASADDVGQSVEAIASCCRTPVRVAERALVCTGSLGVVVPAGDKTTADDLLRRAEMAMYEAKQAGRDAIRFYSTAMDRLAARQFELEADLHRALANDEIEVHFQPLVDLTGDGAIVAFEALARWRHPSLGMVTPVEFISLAEETGLIGPIGERVLERACRRATKWVEEFDANLKISVNLSARQFNDVDLVDKVRRILRECGLPPRNLELEITESVVMRDVARSALTLRELRKMGVALAIDDFGTGYSSLAYLKRFPIDQIKIDQSFVADIANQPEDAAICASIIALAHSLRLTVVAEGVEQDSHLGFLLQHGCDRMQGFLFSTALPADEAEQLLRNKKTLPLKNFGRQLPQRTLLLVDDEEHILSALKRLLRRDGYTILTTSDPAAAFGILAQHKVGVVISDQRMPQMSGTELLRQVKQLYPDITRIVLSGYTDLKTITDAINEGAIYRFLTKPWEDEQLRAATREAFRQQEMAEENRRLSRENREVALKLREANEQLENLLLEKRERIERDENLIGVTQEAFLQVPVPVIGIDETGMIVLATAAAQRIIPCALPGSSVAEALPGSWPAEEGPPCAPPTFRAGGVEYRLIRHRFKVPAGGVGWLLSLMPRHAGAEEPPASSDAMRTDGAVP